MNSNYVNWLKKQGVPLFKAGNIYWRLYQGALVPAPATPCFIELMNYQSAKALLRESGAWFLRYSSEPCDDEKEWWYVVCDKYDPKMFSSNTKSKINRGNRKCLVKQIDAEWLARYSYECYFASFSRYKNATPVNKDIFRDNILKTIKGPFEYWGVFVEDHLAGYCQCIIENGEVATNVIKYDPFFLKYYTSYALINFIIMHYVFELGVRVSNGSRSIAHDTQMQDFLLKFGFRKQFCRLNVIYQPWLKFAIQTLFPLRKLFTYLPDRGPLHKVRIMLAQEGLQRSCQGIVSLQN